VDIKVLGPGCRSCSLLEERTREALAALGVEASIEKVTDFAEIAGHGVMRTPALVVDGQVVAAGRVPTARGIVALLGGSERGGAA
jgi:small redox-active disulfide protein 2